MNKSLQYHTAVNRHDDFDHSVLAELIARHWKQDRSYFTLHETSRGAQLEASWRRQPGRSALESHWSHPATRSAHAGVLTPTREALDGIG